MSSDGYIITNAHVILDEDTSVPMSGVAVLFSDGTQLNATVKGYDSQTDLAVIKVEPSTALSPLNLAIRTRSRSARPRMRSARPAASSWQTP